MRELVGHVTSRQPTVTQDSTAQLYEPSGSYRMMFMDAFLLQGLLEPNKTTSSHQKWELAKKVRLIYGFFPV
jgi:hypothetical protein